MREKLRKPIRVALCVTKSPCEHEHLVYADSVKVVEVETQIEAGVDVMSKENDDKERGSNVSIH